MLSLVSLRFWLFERLVVDGPPVLLVAIPMGRLGDRYGRRNILIVALLGVASSLSWTFTVCMSGFRVCPLSKILSHI
jgi:MFS family permease